MTPSSFFCLTFFFIASLFAFSVSAQPPAPSPDCNAALVSLLPCLDYVQGNVSAPSQNCCVGLGSVVQSNPICLCALFSPSALPIPVNTTLALQLPALCKVATPDRSRCGGNGSTPVQEPVPSPPVTTPKPPTAAPVPPTTAPATPPSVPPSAGTPPTTTVTPPASSTPVMAPATSTTPAVAPSAPMTPSVAPSTTPSVAPSVAPVVAPSAPTPVPASGSPTPTPSPLTGAPGPSPESTPTTPIPSVSSPPSPPPNDNSHAAPYPMASVLSAVVVVFSILFLQM